MKGNLLVFASGDAEGGGSGFENLVNYANWNLLDANIIAVVSNHEHGGVREKADRLGIPFEFMDLQKITAEAEQDKLLTKKLALAMAYQELYRKNGSCHVALSDWMFFVHGLPKEKVFNIHPCPLVDFGGDGKYGHHVHEAVIAAYQAGKIKRTAVSMHFVDPAKKYDDPTYLICQIPVPIKPDDNAKILAARVNVVEHTIQPLVTHLIVTGQIRLVDGAVIVPDWFKYKQQVKLT